MKEKNHLQVVRKDEEVFHLERPVGVDTIVHGGVVAHLM